jgi:hypothetical protein
MIGAGVWIHSYTEFALLCVAVTTIVLAAAWKEIRDVIADIRAARARNKLRIVKPHS